MRRMETMNSTGAAVTSRQLVEAGVTQMFKQQGREAAISMLLDQIAWVQKQKGGPRQSTTRPTARPSGDRSRRHFTGDRT